MLIVLDASAAIELLLRRGAYESVADLVFARGQIAHAPHLVDAEVTQALRRFERRGTVSAVRAEQALDDLRSLRLVRHGHAPLLSRVWSLRENLTAYDALYVALAESLEAPVVTMARRLAAAPGHGAEVVVCG